MTTLLAALAIASHLGAPVGPLAVSSTQAAKLAEFNAQLLRGNSATATLQRWCADRRLADPPVVRAISVRSPGGAPDVQTRRALQVGPSESIAYRRVQLACGARVLSRAENWYVPGRLTAAMNRRLASSDEPFGAVVAQKHFHRLDLGGAWLSGPRDVLRRRALLIGADGAPFSLVVETYSRELLTPVK